MKYSKVSKKTNIIALVLIMTINSLLAIFLLQNTFAQTTENKLNNQPEIEVDVLSQFKNPLRFTIINIDNSKLRFQVVNYTVQNLTDKKIRGYVISAKTKDTGKIITHFLPTKSFQPYDIHSQQIGIERGNIKTDNKLRIFVDYVEFDDGSYWGEDSLGQSDRIKGGIAGTKASVTNLKRLVENDEISALNSLKNQKLVDIDVQIPKTFETKSYIWKRAFRGGYRGIVSFFKNNSGKGNEYLLNKLIEIESSLQNKKGEKVK